MVPKTRSSKPDSEKNKDKNMKSTNNNEQFPSLSPNTTLPTKLPLEKSYSDATKPSQMDIIMKALQDQKEINERNKQKLQNFESNFGNFVSKNNEPIESRTKSLASKFRNFISTNNKNINKNMKVVPITDVKINKETLDDQQIGDQVFNQDNTPMEGETNFWNEEVVKENDSETDDLNSGIDDSVLNLKTMMIVKILFIQQI